MERVEIPAFPTIIVAYKNPDYLKHNFKLSALLEDEPCTEAQGPKNKEGNALHPRQTLDSHLEKREEYSFFYDWVRECLKDYHEHYKLQTENLRICLSWANKSPKMNEHRGHFHPNSWLSGIYYVSDGCTPTFFESPVSQRKTGIVVKSDSVLDHNTWQSPSETGCLILFPSWLEHYTAITEFGGTRITISLNVMPQGLTSDSLIENTY